MADKSWMLNPKAIRHAKECINIIHQLTGDRIKLADPDFIQHLHEHVESTGSQALGEAYARLISMAGVGFVVKGLKNKKAQAPASAAVANHDVAATVVYSGKVYPKYRAGLEFKGVYRGQPLYS